MRRTAAHVALLLVWGAASFLLAGCWDRKEMNELNFAIAFGVDRIENRYDVTAQVFNAQNISANKPGLGSPIVVYEEQGNSVIEALRRMTRFAPRKINGTHLDLLVIGEETARSGILDILDLLARDHEVRPGIKVIIAKDSKAGPLLKFQTPLSKLSARTILDSLQTTEKAWGAASAEPLDKLILALASGGMQEAAVASLELRKPNEESSTIDYLKRSTGINSSRFDGIGVFAGDKLVGWLDERKSLGYGFIAGKIGTTVVRADCGERSGGVAIELVKVKNKLKGSFAGGEPHMSVRVRAEGIVEEATCPMDFTKPGAYDGLERSSARQIKQMLEDTIDEVQRKYGSDIFGFGAELQRSCPDEMKTYERDWKNTFRRMDVDVITEVKIRRSGAIQQTLRQEVEEGGK